MLDKGVGWECEILRCVFVAGYDEDELITDCGIGRWDDETNKQGDEGFMGKVQAFRKKADAKLVEKTVPSDPSKV